MAISKTLSPANFVHRLPSVSLPEAVNPDHLPCRAPVTAGHRPENTSGPVSGYGRRRYTCSSGTGDRHERRTRCLGGGCSYLCPRIALPVPVRCFEGGTVGVVFAGDNMKVHETRSHTRSSAEEEGKIGKGKQKAENGGRDSEQQQASKTKKAKVEGENRDANGKPAAVVAAEFEEFCKATRQHLSINEMRRILEANEQDPSGSDDAVVPRCQDMMFYGPLEKCPVCYNQVDCSGSNYRCRGAYSEWSTCIYTTTDAWRRDQPVKIPEGIGDETVKEWINKQDSRRYPCRELTSSNKPFGGLMISLSGRLSRTHQTWREEIEKHGGKVSNNIIGANSLVVSPAERERGGSSRVAEAMERNIPVVSENWLIDSIQKQQAQPLDAYGVVSDLIPEGRGIPWDKMDPNEEALKSLTAELKLYGKRGVYKDSMLQEQGGFIFEKDGILYNCAFSLCDQGRGINEYCVLQLIQVPDKNMHLYYKKGRVGDDPKADERVEEWNNVDDALKEFVRLFKEVTGNEFETWEREKKFQKMRLKFYPIDMDDGIDVRHGGLSARQLGVAAAHCKLEPLVANFMKVLCSQEIYRYAMMEMGYDCPDLPMGMVTDLHLKRCEEELLKFREDLKRAPDSGDKANVLWLDFSNKWFTLVHSFRPFIMKNLQELADHVAAGLECIRDINVASRLVGDMSGATVDDPLSDRYGRLGCSVAPLDKESDDHKMILKYLETTYEPIKLGDVTYGASVENIFAVESGAGPSYEEVKKLPNKILLWCGTRSSNLIRLLQKGLLPSVCQIPAPGYMFGKAIVCSDASAEAARDGFTAVDRPDGFLLLAVVSLGEQITEMSAAPDDAKELEEKKVSVKGLGRKKPDESQHFKWVDDVKVPCGRLVASEHSDGPLEYNEYAVYDPKQVCMRFVVAVKYEEQNVVAGEE
ncbi:PADR1 (NUC008) domain [Musa troglodytarum]|uniref:Poly [ADP-ribose] polymerase n=1 Tax=Musa troglodytarum TaxID=320322 RepID=A0A9E7HAT5_9LILI|nr:PADR1 (NUC008) domain [Musa troglodytarum]